MEKIFPAHSRMMLLARIEEGEATNTALLASEAKGPTSLKKRNKQDIARWRTEWALNDIKS
jgi:hypothetical protein